jgi:hypothetical protein
MHPGIVRESNGVLLACKPAGKGGLPSTDKSVDEVGGWPDCGSLHGETLHL